MLIIYLAFSLLIVMMITKKENYSTKRSLYVWRSMMVVFMTIALTCLVRFSPPDKQVGQVFYTINGTPIDNVELLLVTPLSAFLIGFVGFGSLCVWLCSVRPVKKFPSFIRCIFGFTGTIFGVAVGVFIGGLVLYLGF